MANPEAVISLFGLKGGDTMLLFGAIANISAQTLASVMRGASAAVKVHKALKD